MINTANDPLRGAEVTRALGREMTGGGDSRWLGLWDHTHPEVLQIRGPGYLEVFYGDTPIAELFFWMENPKITWIIWGYFILGDLHLWRSLNIVAASGQWPGTSSVLASTQCMGASWKWRIWFLCGDAETGCRLVALWGSNFWAKNQWGLYI